MALLGQSETDFKQSYMEKKTGGVKKPVLHQAGGWRKPKRKRQQKRYDRQMKGYNKEISKFGGEYAEDFDNRSQSDYSGTNIEKRYGKDVADTIMDAHSAGETGNYERFQFGEEGGIEQLNFGDVAMAAGRVQNRRDLLTNIEEGKFGGGTGLGQSDSGGAGENIFSSSAGTQKKKKKSNLLGSGESMSTARLGYV